MKVFSIGASRNIGYFASVRLLEKGHTITFLLRNTDAFADDALIQKYLRSGTARLVKGDALNKDDVERGWAAAAAPGPSDADPASPAPVDTVIFSVGTYARPPTPQHARRLAGGLPNFSILHGVVLDPPDLCTHALLNTLATLPTPAPRLVALSSTGLSRPSRANLPLAIRLLYRLFHSAHVDKQAMERVLARAGGVACAPAAESVARGLLPGGWEARVPAHAVDAVVVRPALLTDGECRTETKGAGTVRVRAEGDLPVKGGYTVGRKDVAWFIAERLLGGEWEQWKGKGVSLAY